MRSNLVAFGAIASAALLLAINANASTGPIPLNCDRLCLESLVDQYLAAVVAHDPKRLPLSAGVRYTENDQLMDVGDGFWKTAEGVGNYKHIFADPEAGQVAFMGTMHEAGAPLLMSLRLRVELGRITEIESIYFKPGGAGPNNIAAMDSPGYKAEDIWFKSIPPAQRLSRQEIVSVADAYFSGLEKNDGKGVNGTGTYPFTNDCDRIENGSHTTNVPRPPNEPKDAINGFALAGHPSPPLSAGGCRARRRLVARGLRSGHGELGRPFRWPPLFVPGVQPAFQYSGFGGVPD
jgi:hypothetical protein